MTAEAPARLAEGEIPRSCPSWCEGLHYRWELEMAGLGASHFRHVAESYSDEDWTVTVAEPGSHGRPHIVLDGSPGNALKLSLGAARSLAAAVVHAADMVEHCR